MSTLTASQLQQQYIAYFGRPGDPAGIKYWLSSASGITTEREFADKIYAQDEYKTSTVGSKSTEEQVNQLYLNLFGRSADATGLLYWTGQIENGTLSLSNIALDLIHSANNPSAGNSAQGALDAAALSNKLAAATAFTADVEASADAILSYQPETESPWKSGAAFESAQSFITGITTVAHTAAGVDTAVAAMIVAKPAVAAESKTLTTSLDTITTGAGNDTITGGKGTIDSDVIDGGAGTDTLSLTLTNADDDNAVFTSSNVENLKFRVSGASGVTLDLGDVTGATSITAERTGSTLTLNDVQAISPLTVDRNTDNANITVAHNATVDAGTSDSMTINIKNSSNAGTINVDGIETVNLVSTDSPTDDTNELQIDSAGTGTATEVLNISGAGDTTVVATDSLTVNNSASGDVTLTPTAATTITHTGSGKLTTTTGVVDVTATASGTGALFFTDSNAGDTTVTGSSGADRFDFQGNLDTDDVVTGGTGTDTLVILGDGVTSAADGDLTVSGVEILEIDSDTTSDNLDFDKFANPAEITSVVIDSTDEGDVVSLTDTQASTFTINNGPDNSTEDIANVVIDLKDATGSADAITINLNNKQTGAATKQDDFAITTGITANAIETISINTSYVSALGTAEDITLAALTSDVISTLNISGTADLQITAALDTDLDTITSTSTGATTLTVAGSDITYTGGSGVDTLSFGTSLTAADTVNGGAGTDVVNATFSAGTITPANFSNVETFNATFTGGSLNAGGLSDLTKITIVDASAAAMVSALTNTTTTITQKGGGSAALNVLYASGSDATVTYNIAAATENVANASTTFTNAKNLTVAGGAVAATTRTLALGSLNGGSALDSLTVTTAGESADTVDTGAISGVNLQTLTVTADEANLTLGAFSAAGELKTLAISNLSGDSAGDIIIGNIGAGSAADEITTFTLLTEGSSSGGSTVVDMGNIDAAGATFTTFSIDLKGNYGSSDIDIVTAEGMGDISMVTDDNGTGLTVDQFDVEDKTTSSIGNVTINVGAAFDGADEFLTTGTAGTVGNISITSKGATTIADADGEEIVHNATTVGNITLVASAAAASLNLGDIDVATTIGDISFTGTGTITWDGAPLATTLGTVSGSVAAGEEVDLTDNANTMGTTGGVMGSTTVTGGGTFRMDVGAVTTLGNIDLSGMTGTSVSTMILSNTTTVGVIYTGGDGADAITGTGGADTINPGVGIDTVTGNDGADAITITETSPAADTIVLTDDDSVDSITGFTAVAADDVFSFDLSALNIEIGQNLRDSTNDIAATDSIVVETFAEGIIAKSAIAATANVFIMTDTDNNSLPTSGWSLTLDANTTTSGDGILLVHYDADGGFASVGHFVDAGANADATFTAGIGIYTEMAQATMSTTEYAALAAANFALS